MVAIAWLIKNCPNFYFLPSQAYDKIFTKRGSPAEKMSLEYWISIGFPAFPLFQCDEVDATHWIVNDNYGLFDAESADAARHLQKSVVPVKLIP